MTTKRTIRVFAEPTGFFFCDDSLDYLDTRGSCYATEAEATEAAIRNGEETAKYGNPDGSEIEFIGVTGSGVCRETAEAMGCEVI